MKLSIVIPCYNEAKTIRQIVDHVRASPIADKEIVIVDVCSLDDYGMALQCASDDLRREAITARKKHRPAYSI